MGRGVAAGLLGIRAESPPEAGQGGGSVRSRPLPSGPCLGSPGAGTVPAPSLLPHLSHKPGDLWEFSMDLYHHDYCCHQSGWG